MKRGTFIKNLISLTLIPKTAAALSEVPRIEKEEKKKGPKPTDNVIVYQKGKPIIAGQLHEINWEQKIRIIPKTQEEGINRLNGITANQIEILDDYEIHTKVDVEYKEGLRSLSFEGYIVAVTISTGGTTTPNGYDTVEILTTGAATELTKSFNEHLNTKLYKGTANRILE